MGETVQLTVSFENAPAASGCHLRLGFDPQVLIPTSATCLLEEGTFLSNLSSHHATDLTDLTDLTEVNLVWASTEALPLTGECFTVTFLVKEGAAAGKTALGWKQAEFAVDGKKIAIAAKDSSITVIGNQVPGSGSEPGGNP